MCWKLLLLLLLSMFVYVDTEGNCDIKDPEYEDEWKSGDMWISINDTDVNSITKINQIENIEGISLDHKYLEHHLDIKHNTLTFSMKQGYENFIKNENELEMKRQKMIFTCSDGKTTNPKYLTLNVTETKNYDPKFDQVQYSFKLPMPILPNQTIESTTIKVTDYNIQESLSFSFDAGDQECSRYFDFETTRYQKIYTTNLKAKDHVNLDKNISCSIQVKDTREGVSKSKINIVVDIENSKVPNPIFREPIEIVFYADHLTVNLELLSALYTPIPTISSKGCALHTYFTHELQTNNKIKVFLKEPIPQDKLDNINYFVLLVEVKYNGADNSAKTAILIDVTKNSGTTTMSTTSETDLSSCPSCPDCTTTTFEPSNNSSCEPCSTIYPESTLPGDSSTCPECSTNTFPVEGTTNPTASTTSCAPCIPGTTTMSTTSETDLSSCPSCPDCTTTTFDPGNNSSCEPCSTIYTESTLPGDSSTCPECSTNTFPVEGTTNPIASTTSCAPCIPAPKVKFNKKSALHVVSIGTTGLVDTFNAISDISYEEIVYDIKSVYPAGAKSKFLISNMGEVTIKEEVDEGTYNVLITASGKQSQSQDEATMFLLIKDSIINCHDNSSVQVERSLINFKVKEHEPPKKIVDAMGNYFEITDDNDDIHDWFRITDGNLEIQEIDREDKRIKTLLAPQIQVKVRVKKHISTTLGRNSLTYTFVKYFESAFQPGFTCISIKDMDVKPDTMTVLVSVEDINDNSPVFVENKPLAVGYPEAKLIEFIAPPYLIKVTATDEDVGVNAKIKYTTNNKNFIADADNGMIFIAEELSDDCEFKIIAEDNNGNGGNRAELSVMVKLLKEEHILVITLENIIYSEIEEKVNQISMSTQQTVKYLTSTAIPKLTEEKKKLIYPYSKDEKIPVVRLILYALDKNNEVIPAKEFKRIADDTGIKMIEYVAVLRKGSLDKDTTGWIAAVSTLSTLLGLVIIGGLLGYIYYLRPRMIESSSFGYIKHTNRDSIRNPPIETKMESASTISDRRPTGFPIGYTPKNLDEDDYEEVEDTNKTEIMLKEGEGINNSENSISTESERRKSGVTFDTNVTEIEIEEF